MSSSQKITPVTLLLVISVLFFVDVSQAQNDSTRQIFNQADSADLLLLPKRISQQALATETVSGKRLPALSNLPLGHILQGQAAGIWSMQTSAQPAGLTSLWIRGYNSSNADNQPLIVLDGMPLYNNQPFIEVSRVDPLSLLNPHDIASIEIIKDGSAARYGFRGFNGVILINTRKGKKGSFNVNFDNKIGFQTSRRLLPLMNAQEYGRYLNEIFQEDSVIFTDEEIQALGEGTNWQKEIFDIAPVLQNHLSISGNTRKIQYYLSGSYLNQQGIVKNSDFKRYTFLGNMTYHITKRLSITSQINHAQAHSLLTPKEVIRHTLSFSPTISVRDSLGNYTSNKPFNYGFEENPMELIDRVDNQLQSSQLFRKATISYRLLDSLFVKVSASKNTTESIYNYIPEEGFQPRTDERNHEISTYLINPSIFYHHVWNQHEVETTLGYSFQKETRHLKTMNSHILEPWKGSRSESRNTRAYTTPIWGNFSYQFDRRYLIFLGGRLETTPSLFIDKKVFSPTVAFAWKLHNESFVPDWIKQNEVTFRSSYGNIENIFASFDLTRNQVLTFSERNRQWNFGLDISLLDKHLSVSVDAYQKSLKNLASVGLPSTTGYNGAFTENLKVQNRGFEFTLAGYQNFGDVLWNARLNLSRNENQVVSIPDDFRWLSSSTSLPSTSFITDEGTPVWSFRGYVDNGLFTSEDEVESSDQVNATLGGLKFLDVSGGREEPDNLINYYDDIAIGHAQPVWQTSLYQHAEYRRWLLEALLYANIGNETLNYQKYIQQSGAHSINQYKKILNRWSPERPESTIPTRTSASNISTYAVENASFLRLRYITVSYRIPSEKRWNTKLYASAQNLFTFTSYEGYDPEVSNFGQRANALGVDFDSYPRARTFLLGCQLTF